MRIESPQDKFASLLVDPQLHRVAWDPVRLGAYVSNYVDALEDPRDRLCARLAVLIATRRYLDIINDETFRWLSSVERDHSTDTSMCLRVRIARGALLGSTGKYESAWEEFAYCVNASRHTNDHLAYAFGNKGLGDVCLHLGRYAEAERAYEDALSTFRRFDCELWTAFVTNNLGIVKRRLGEYDASLRLIERAREVVERLGIEVSVLDANVTLGIVLMRRGEWKTARRCLERARAMAVRMAQNASTEKARALWESFSIPLPRLASLQRRFGEAERAFLELVRSENRKRDYLGLIHEHVGEMYFEMGRAELAEQHLVRAYEVAKETLPESENMAEVLRRQAQLWLLTGELPRARDAALQCIRLSRKIGDRYELGAAIRVLGEIFVAEGQGKRAMACFRAAINVLRSIHECYELMRTLYAKGRLLGMNGGGDDAETSLLEARQLARKLELDYYQALIAIALADMLGPQERFDEASRWVAEATSLRDELEGVDRERVEDELKRAANDLQERITRASVKSAETLKTICHVFEDARFPFEDMRADLAYQVAQSIGADRLFVIGRRGQGLRVPITYNISAADAKELIRRLDRGPKKKPLLEVENDPRIIPAHDRRTLVAVPCHAVYVAATGARTVEEYVACAVFDGSVRVQPRQLELFCASAEALARLIEEEDVRRAVRKGTVVVSDDDDDEKPGRARHPRGSFKDILTIDSTMIKLIKTAELAASSTVPILLEGETGVGKELFARAIHDASPRKDNAFVAINAGGMPVQLLESELFGHVRGAFTDAGNDRVGLVDTARNGTLFLDEIGEMGEEMQVKLLRLLENGEYRRLGESTTRTADIRLISATNRDLRKEMERDGFRRDLYYRVSTVKLTVPPLRMRSSDIQLLTRYFLRECARINGIADRYIEMDVKAMEALELYEWPGNVRELFNEILRLVSLIGRGDFIKFAMLSEHIKDYLKSTKRSDGLLDRSVEQYERRLILDALDKNDWNNVRTADALAIPRTTLIAKLRRMNIASR